MQRLPDLIGQHRSAPLWQRGGEMIPRGLIKTITGMLMELGQDVYCRDFEQPFLQRSADFYNVESNEYLAQNSAPDYMKKVRRPWPRPVAQCAVCPV